jgi:hypothetical protein
MIIQPLGMLEPDPDLDDWFRSVPLAVPFFDGLRLPFVLRDVQNGSSLIDHEHSLNAFLALGATEREHAGRFVFQVYRQFVEAVGQDQLDFSISNARDVWDCVTPTEIHVSRRHRRDRLVYVQILAECQWEEEHGLMVIYRSGSTLSRVSDQDGHLTTSDAFDLPEGQDRIIREG